MGKDYSSGAEIMLNVKPWKFWTVNLSGNAYYYREKGVLYNEPFEEDNFNWSTRYSNIFTIDPTTRIQLDGMYVSASVSAQEKREAFTRMDMALKKDFFQRKLTATLQARDLLGTMKFKVNTNTPTFKSRRVFKHSSTMIQFTLSYKINNYKTKERERGGAGNGMEDREGGEGF